MKKAFRGIKRGVNKNVLKVPSIEQKVLDATSNDSWGPHGSQLADIAQASKNYHDHQIIMSVVRKRLSDTGKNWRHVFKSLTVLEYLVANGSDRVIEDIREYAYQISMLVTFQYVDSTGRDQGINIRQKSQSLVALVNDKEKIQEARDKASASKDKFRQSGGQGDDRYEGQYGSRDEDRNGYGRERDSNSRDSYGRDGDDEYRGKSQSVDGDYGTKSQSSDRDDGHHSSRESNSRVEDGSPDVSRLERKSFGQILGAPPSYQDAVSGGETPPPPANHQETVLSNNSAPPPPSAATIPPPSAVTPSVINESEEFDFFDPRGAPPAAPSASSNAEVDFFGSLSDSFSSDVLALVPSEPPATSVTNPSQTFEAAPPTSQQFDDPFGDGPFRAVPSTNGFSTQQSTSPFGEPPSSQQSTPFGEPLSAQQSTSPFGEPFSAQESTTPFGEPFSAQESTTPFGEPFSAQQSTPFGESYSAQQSTSPFGESFSAQQSTSPFGEPPEAYSQTTMNDMGFGDSFDPTIDILAGILPPTGPPALPSQTVNNKPQTDQHSTQISYPSQNGQPNQTSFPSSFPGPFGQPMPQSSYPGQFSQPMPQSSYPGQFSQPMPQSSNPGQFGQPMPQSSNPGQFSQPMPQSSYAGQPMPPSAFPAQGGYHSSPQPNIPTHDSQLKLTSGFLDQGSKSMSPPSFSAAPGGQSVLPPHFAASQGGQSEVSSGFPTQGGQSVLPSSFPVAQGGPSELPSGLSAATSSQSVMPSSFPVAQGGPSELSSGFQATSGQSVLPPSFSAAQSGQSDFSSSFSATNGQSVLPPAFPATQGGLSELSSGFPAAPNGQPALPQTFPTTQGRPSEFSSGFPAAQNGQSVLPPSFPAGQHSVLPHGFPGSQNGSSQLGSVSQVGFSNLNGQTVQHNNNTYSGFQPQGQPTLAPTPPVVSFSSYFQQSNTSMGTQPPPITASTGALAIVPQQPAKEKFETKSTVWADTLNRGLVNLNISGSKTNPLSDIGIDFEAINRKEKRMEKPSKTPVTSNVSMGKAMGSGSGIGRAGAGGIRPAPNSMMGSGMGMGMGMGAPGGYGGVRPQMGLNNMPQNMGMGMNNGQGFQMQAPPATGFMPPGSYNPMMGRGGGGYGQQQPYGGY